MKSELEKLFAFQLDSKKIRYETEFKFCGDRKFKADFSIGGGILIEINGGIYMDKSGHNSISGITRDYEKCNLAQRLGYKLFCFTPKDVKSGTAIKFIEDVIKEWK